jgi:HprK-related kinase A
LIVGDLDGEALARVLSGPGLRLRTGPIVTQITSPLDDVARAVGLLYRDHPVDEAFADFHVRIDRPRGLRRWVKPQVQFQFDGWPPFYPLPGDQGFPILEWGMNWCVSTNCHQYLVVHAAVVERGGRALILPAPPGSGKSTLCAGLVHRGWRLLSDELTLLEPSGGQVIPLPRPVSLKNASIEVMGRFAPGAVFSPTVHDTLKGSVAHMKPPLESVHRLLEPATPRWVVMPRYEAGAPARLERLGKGRAFMQIVDSAFNYHLHAQAGFELVGQVIDACDCYEFTYGDLEEAATVFADLAASA